MDYLIELILALPVEKIWNLFCLKDYLNDSYKKDILENLLRSTTDTECKSDLFDDPVFPEIERFNKSIIEAWGENTKSVLNEDCRLDFFVYLFKSNSHKKQFQKLQKRIDKLFDLYTNYKMGFAANMLNSLYCALAVTTDAKLDGPRTGKEAEKNALYPLVAAALQKKYLGEMNEQKIQDAKIRVDHFHKIKVLCDLDFELDLLKVSLQSYIDDEKRKNLEENPLIDNLVSICDICSSMQ